MTIDELINTLQAKITPELRHNFEQRTMVDYIGDRPTIENYTNTIANLFKEEYLQEKDHVISFLKKQKLLNNRITSTHLKDDDLKPLIMTCIRRQLLRFHGEFIDYEDKLKFILESNETFNFFRIYDIPDYGKFTGLPNNYTDKKLFINFISENSARMGQKFNIFGSRIRFIKTFPELKASFFFKLDEANYKYEIDKELMLFSKLIENDSLSEYRNISYFVLDTLIKNKLSLMELFISIEDPLEYFIILFLCNQTLPYVEYSNFLNDFKWDNHVQEINHFKANQFSYLVSTSQTKKIEYFDENGSLILSGQPEFLTAIKKLIGNEISKRDFVIIFEAISGLRTHLNEIDNHSFETQVEKTLKKIAKRYIAIYNSIQSDDIKEIFFPTLLEYLQSYKTDKLNSIRIAFLTDYIQKQFEGDIPSKSEYDKSLPTESFKKLQTNLSVPELAQLFNLLNELKPSIFCDISEAELHKFINATIESKKSGPNGISTKKLKNLFNQPNPKAVEFWKDKIPDMLHNNLKK